MDSSNGLKLKLRRINIVTAMCRAVTVKQISIDSNRALGIPFKLKRNCACTGRLITVGYTVINSIVIHRNLLRTCNNDLAVSSVTRVVDTDSRHERQDEHKNCAQKASAIFHVIKLAGDAAPKRPSKYAQSDIPCINPQTVIVNPRERNNPKRYVSRQHSRLPAIMTATETNW